ncbi:MAG: TIGR04372 family glycosyltransferase, partial [Gammaproteobacteria bacterium]|nr:TIGR04372 family glycosyltransferase [Gammaproteobacteria bacterium]
METIRQLWVRMIYAFNRARDEGVCWTAYEIVVRSALWFVWLCLLPLVFLLHIAGYRRLPVFTQRIGHLAAEVDCFLKLKQLGEIVGSEKIYFILAPASQVANLCLLDYWRDHVVVVSNPLACWALSLLTRGPLLKYPVKNYLLSIGRSAQYYSVQARWADRPALLKLRTKHEELVRNFLHDVGIPKDAWFVCVHSRESGYSGHDESVHGYRNTTVDHLLIAMQEIVARGGWCIRMGDSTMKPLPPMRGVLDYALHPSKSAELDVFLCAQCRFFLGNTSGLFLVSTIFGVNAACANFVPFDKEIRIRFSFQMYDEMKSGFISQKEIEEILRGNHMIGLASIQRKAETVMKQATTNKTGT